MSDKNFMLALRAAMAREVETAPRQHPKRTPECPPLTRFVPDAHWSEQETAHLASCCYCGMLLHLMKGTIESQRGQIAEGMADLSENGLIGGGRQSKQTPASEPEQVVPLDSGRASLPDKP
jgi:hypothetical protein